MSLIRLFPLQGSEGVLTFLCLSLPDLPLFQGLTSTTEMFDWKVHNKMEGSEWAGAIEIQVIVLK